MMGIAIINNCSFSKEHYTIVNATSAKMSYKNPQAAFTWHADADINFVTYAVQSGAIHTHVRTLRIKPYTDKKQTVVAVT